MKITFTLLLLVIALQMNAQRTYETITDNDKVSKIFKGLISKEVLQYESSFKWFENNSKNYQPNAAAVAALKENGHKITILAFGGTWCEDTQNILPKFFKLITEAGFLQSQLTLYGVDRPKKTTGTIAEDNGITNVPTFIILQNGKELGRVVEYGKTGQWDKEIGEIVKMAK
jgi:thiol-disulfide isomerase/thioredoxin